MRLAAAHALRFAVLALLFAAVAGLSDRPRHRSLPEGTGVLKVSFVHGADRKAACRKRSAEEIAALPPNMRQRVLCPRQRPSLYVEIDLDGRRLFAADLPPSGIAGDGPSRLYERFVLPAGSYEVAVRLRDTGRAEGYEWQASERIEIAPAASRVIDFRPADGGFVFH